MLSNHIKLSKLAKLSVLFVLLCLAFNVTFRHYEGMKIKSFVMSSDMEGYYQYLPHVFLMPADEIKNMRWAKQYGEDAKLNAYTCGVAIMQMPFFLIAHGITLYLELEPNGYGPIYFTSVFIAAIFYVLAGLIFMYYVLRRYFTPKLSFWIVFLLFYATNLFYYTIISPGMSHAYSFSLVAMYLYFVPLFYEKTNLRNTVLMAIPLGLLTLIRPTSIVFSLYFLLYNLTSLQGLKERILFLLKRWYFVLVIALVGFVVFIPQMLYWHAVTGKYFLYSYQEEGFINILSPHISTVLIGPRNGWFVYTPLMFVAFLSLLYMGYKKKLNSIPTLLILVIIVYINGSWWRPTFSGAAGYRALIEYIPLMAVPLGYFMNKVSARNNKTILRVMIGVFVLFVIYNILFAFRYSPWIWWNTEWQWSHMLRLVRF